MTKNKLVRNLKRTIEGKELLLQKYLETPIADQDFFSKKVGAAFIQTNLDELRRILADVELLPD